MTWGLFAIHVSAIALVTLLVAATGTLVIYRRERKALADSLGSAPRSLRSTLKPFE